MFETVGVYSVSSVSNIKFALVFEATRRDGKARWHQTTSKNAAAGEPNRFNKEFRALLLLTYYDNGSCRTPLTMKASGG
ncbi:hypothetical protein J6590_049216 [Homalodisca vitripennis]|nr:hypothetical protein J6590_049216 [Homalodisca vitripennis]